MTALIKLKWAIVARDCHLQEVSGPVSSNTSTKMLLKETAEDFRLTVAQSTFHFLILNYILTAVKETFLELGFRRWTDRRLLIREILVK
jgi:hypothetical protein